MNIIVIKKLIAFFYPKEIERPRMSKHTLYFEYEGFAGRTCGVSFKIWLNESTGKYSLGEQVHSDYSKCYGQYDSYSELARAIQSTYANQFGNLKFINCITFRHMGSDEAAHELSRY